MAARADERERIRQDLHDGLGPALAGIAFSAAAVQHLLPATSSRPCDGADDGVAAAAAVAGSIAQDVAAASREVRRIVDGLQPAGLEGRTLVEALRAEAERVGRVPRTAADGAQQPLLVDLDLPGGPGGGPPLPEDVEVALYRTAVEALHNAARHGRAERALVRLRVGERAELEVLDSTAGCHDPVPWEAGTGLRGIARRTAELGGTWWAGPTPQGGRVVVDVPLPPPVVTG
nr:histidine kinase [Quadrisphaera sp. RL12-1S]